VVIIVGLQKKGATSMTRKAHSADEIVAKLRLVDELNLQGRAVGEAVQAIGVTEVTYYRWKRLYGGLEYEVVEWLKELEAENARLRRAVSDLTLDKLILIEAANERLLSPELRRACVESAKAALGVSERRACRVLGQHRSTQRKRPRSLGGAGHDNGHRQHSAAKHC
jgi:putative transposase